MCEQVHHAHFLLSLSFLDIYNKFGHVRRIHFESFRNFKFIESRKRHVFRTRNPLAYRKEFTDEIIS